MYNLKDFIPYAEQLISNTQIVLAWSKSGGYHFIEAGKLTDDAKIIGMEDL